MKGTWAEHFAFILDFSRASCALVLADMGITKVIIFRMFYVSKQRPPKRCSDPKHAPNNKILITMALK